MTRLRATDVAVGCTNCTDWPVPILKVCQFSAALSVPWSMRMLLAVGVLMVACPATTAPPVGSSALDSGDTSARRLLSRKDSERPARMR